MRRFLVLVALAACSAPAREVHPVTTTPVTHAAKTITIIGTSDLHGALVRLPLFAGYVANVRAARAADGGGVLLVDAGDLFQGTLESNTGEGVDVVRAYNALGYAAAAIGNHEFDYGPPGPDVIAKSPSEDPRGALKARIGEARFPFLAANIIDRATGARIAWSNVAASRLVEVAGVKIGVIGAATPQTPYTTMPANFAGLEVAPVAAAIEREARALRGQGAQLIVVTAHVGSACKDLEHPDDVSSCDREDELFHVLDALPKGTVDVFVAGHTHALVAHRIDGVAAIESLSSGRAFGRVDVRVESGHVTDVLIHRPELVCPLDKDKNPVPVADCHPGPYEGRAVIPDAAIQKIADDALARAGQRRAEKLGVLVASTITKAYGSESAEGDLFGDLMLAARPDADVSLTNGGGLRADIPPGELTYGKLFEAMPFDNRFAIVRVKGKHIRTLVESNLRRGGGIFSWGGLSARARCERDHLSIDITIKGKPLEDDATYKLVTSDFLASGGDGALGKLGLPPDAFQTTDQIIRDAMADVLRAQRGTIDPKQIIAQRRMDYPGQRPVECSAKGNEHE